MPSQMGLAYTLRLMTDFGIDFGGCHTGIGIIQQQMVPAAVSHPIPDSGVLSNLVCHVNRDKLRSRASDCLHLSKKGMGNA